MKRIRQVGQNLTLSVETFYRPTGGVLGWLFLIGFGLGWHYSRLTLAKGQGDDAEKIILPPLEAYPGSFRERHWYFSEALRWARRQARLYIDR